MRLRHLERFLDDLDALALKHVREGCVVFETDVIERRDQFAGGAVPIVKHRRDDAARLEIAIEPNAVVHLQGGRMIGAGPGHLLEEIVVSERLDKRNSHVFLSERQRQAKANRTSPYDDNAFSRMRHGSTTTAGRRYLPQSAAQTECAQVSANEGRPSILRSAQIHCYRFHGRRRLAEASD